MKVYGIVVVFFLALALQSCTRNVVVTTTKVHMPSYICFDGRKLTANQEGLVWLAKRGCFITKTPCASLQAGQYGVFNNTNSLQNAFASCRTNYPFRLGEMQTH